MLIERSMDVLVTVCTMFKIIIAYSGYFAAGFVSEDLFTRNPSLDVD